MDKKPIFNNLTLPRPMMGGQAIASTMAGFLLIVSSYAAKGDWQGFKDQAERSMSVAFTYGQAAKDELGRYASAAASALGVKINFTNSAMNFAPSEMAPLPTPGKKCKLGNSISINEGTFKCDPELEQKKLKRKSTHGKWSFTKISDNEPYGPEL